MTFSCMVTIFGALHSFTLTNVLKSDIFYFNFFLFALRTSFNISYDAGLLAVNFFNFCISEQVKYIFIGLRIMN